MIRRRLGYANELELIVNTIGDSIMNGEYILKSFKEAGADIGDVEDINIFFTYWIDREVVTYNPDVYEICVSNMERNDYCLTKEYLREYKLNQIGI